MRRALLIMYAAIAYVGFLLTMVWAMAFLANFKLDHTVDRGDHASTTAAVAIDIGLLALFGLHHSVMSRPGAKAVLTRFVPREAERATYVLGADVFLGLVVWAWRPLPHTVWHVDATPVRVALWAICLFGWALAVAATFMIDHLDLVGLKQVVSRNYRPPVFQVKWAYGYVRHPLQLGLLIAFWVTPDMSVGHLLFAAVWSLYIWIGLYFEQRGLRAELGAPYIEYLERTPALLPRRRR